VAEDAKKEEVPPNHQPESSKEEVKDEIRGTQE